MATIKQTSESAPSDTIHVSGTIGINILTATAAKPTVATAAKPTAAKTTAQQWEGQVVCLYDVHNQDQYCRPPPQSHHVFIDEFIEKLNVCSIVIEEPFLPEPSLKAIFFTEHVKKLKQLYDQKSIQLHGTDIRLNMLYCSLHVLHEMNNRQTLLQYLTPILSIFRTHPTSSNNPTLDALYRRATAKRPTIFYPEIQHVKLRKIKKEFLTCLTVLPNHYQNQMIYLYQTLQQRVYEFVTDLHAHLDDELYTIVKKSAIPAREPLNKDFPFSNQYIQEYHDDSKPSILESNWMYRLELIIDATMEMFTVGKLLKHWQPCNVIYMGLVHMARITHWLKTYFAFHDVAAFGTTEQTLPKHLDEIQTSDSCVSL